MRYPLRLCALGLILAAIPPAASAQPSFRGIGMVPGDNEGTSLLSISDDGRFAVGYSSNGVDPHAFRWSAGGGFTPLGDLPGGDVYSLAYGVSAHGFHVVGESKSAAGDEAFRWQGGVMMGMGDLAGGDFSSRTHDVSADGSIILGTGAVDFGGAPRQRAWRSVKGGPLTAIEPVPGESDGQTTASGLSADGAIVVGGHRYITDNIAQAFRWTQGGGFVLLGDLAGGTLESQTGGVSADGSVVVGDGTSNAGREAFRWTAPGGMVGLGDLPGGVFRSSAVDVSADGSVIVGIANYNPGAQTADAFIWDAQNGMRNLQGVLEALGVQGLAGWQLLQATGVSGDGLTVAGVGINPDGKGEGFIAYLGQACTKTTERASVSFAEQQGNNGSSGGSVSNDGNIVAFWSNATNLVGGDTNGRTDVFFRNRSAGWTGRVSLSTAGVQGNGNSTNPHISGNGRFVVFASDATNLVPNDTNGRRDIFIRDRVANITARLSIATNGAQANGHSDWPRITADGRFVVFESDATNLVAGDTNAATDVFVRDRQSGTTTRASISSAGPQGNGPSYDASIADNGLTVVFTSDATNLVPGDSNGSSDVFLRNRTTGQTGRVSVGTNLAQGNQASFGARISANGRYIAFTTSATNLALGDTNAADDVLVRDRFNGTTTRITLAPGQANSDSAVAAISSNGRYVLYNSYASNLVGGDTNAARDAFIHDNWTFLTTRASLGNNGQQAASACVGTSLSANGRFAIFNSLAGNLVPGDSGFSDVFLRDLCRP